MSNPCGIQKCLGIGNKNLGFEVTTAYLFPLARECLLYVSATAEVFIKYFYDFNLFCISVLLHFNSQSVL